MKLKNWIICFSMFTLLSSLASAQDFTKLIEIQTKIQKLTLQLPTASEAEAEQIQAQIQALTKEMMIEGQKLEHEAMGQGEAPTEVLSQEEFTKKTLKDLEATVNSLPPPLKEIYLLERQLDDLEPETDADKINNISEQIMDKMGKIYSGDVSIDPTYEGFIVGIKFCKKGTVLCEVEGSMLDGDLIDVNYKLVISAEINWVAEYMIDVIQKKGYLIGYFIDTNTLGEDPPETKFPKLSGSKQIFQLGAAPTKGPVDKFKVDDADGYVQIVPSMNKIVDPVNPQNWPEEMAKEYKLKFLRPNIYFYSSMDDEKLTPYVPYALVPVETTVTTNELNKGIQQGEFRKTITLSDPPGPCLATTLKFYFSFQPLICDEKGNPGAMAVSGACIDHGGYIMAKEDHVYVQGKPVARVGDKVLCFRHGVTEIVGDKDVEVYSNKERVARVGDKTKCGAVIQGGQVNIYAGEKGK